MAQTDRDSTTTTPTSPPAKFIWRGNWVTATVYTEYDVLRYDGASYITLETHTAGTFATDLAAGKVELFVDKGLSGSGSGDMLGSANLSEIADDAAARSNIGAAKSGANTDISSLGAITLIGDITMSGAAIITAEGAAVTAAATTNIWATDGDTKHVTGNTGITSFGTAPQAGARTMVIFDGTPVLTQSADLNLNAGGANITIEAGDWAEVYADTTTQFDVVVHRKSGLPVVSPAGSIVKLITDSTDIALAVAAVATQSNVGSTFSINIPTSGFIRMASFVGRILNNAVASTHITGFGIRIGSTNYWFGKQNRNGVTNYANMIQTPSTASGFYEYYGQVDTNGAAGAAGNADGVMDIAQSGIPTGTQTVQLIAGYESNQTTLKGATITTKVILEFVSV